MNKKQLEKQILVKLKEIRDIYLQYNPYGDYFTLCFMKNSDNEVYYNFNNNYTQEDKSKPINFVKFEKENK